MSILPDDDDQGEEEEGGSEGDGGEDGPPEHISKLKSTLKYIKTKLFYKTQKNMTPKSLSQMTLEIFKKL
jgi:hypothetical protein